MEEARITSFKGKNYFLSNMYQTPVHYQDKDFTCAEAAFQAAKCLNPENEKDFTSMDGYTAKREGKKVQLRPDWDEVKFDVMQEIIHAKFENPELREMLAATKDTELVEGNHWGDVVWGVDSRTGQGENRLGKILMAEREFILKEMEKDTQPKPEYKESQETATESVATEESASEPVESAPMSENPAVPETEVNNPEFSKETLLEMQFLYRENEIHIDASGAAYTKTNGRYLSEERANALESMGVEFNKEETLKRASVQEEQRKRFRYEEQEDTEEAEQTNDVPEEKPSEETISSSDNQVEEQTASEQEPEEEPAPESESEPEPEADSKVESKEDPVPQKAAVSTLKQRKATVETVNSILRGEEPSAEKHPEKTLVQSKAASEVKQPLKEKNSDSDDQSKVTANPESQVDSAKGERGKNKPVSYSVSTKMNGAISVEVSTAAGKNTELTTVPENRYPVYMSTMSKINYLGRLINENIAILVGREVSSETNTAYALVLFNPEKLAELDAHGVAEYELANHVTDEVREQMQQTYQDCRKNYSECYKITKALKMNKAIAEMVEDKSSAMLNNNPYMFERIDNSGYLVSYTPLLETLNELTINIAFDRNGNAGTIEVPLEDIREKGILGATLHTEMLLQTAEKRETRTYDEAPKITIGRYKNGSIGIKNEESVIITTAISGDAVPYMNFINKNLLPYERSQARNDAEEQTLTLNQMIQANICAINGKGNQDVVPVVFNPEAIQALNPKGAEAYEKKSGITQNDHIVAQERYEFAREAAASLKILFIGANGLKDTPAAEELIGDRIDALSAGNTTYRFRAYGENGKITDYDVQPAEKGKKLNVLLTDASPNSYGETAKVVVDVKSAIEKGVLNAAFEQMRGKNHKKEQIEKVD